MRRLWLPLVVLMTLMLGRTGSANATRALSLSFGEREAWHVSADEPWWALVDIRDMLNIFHPFLVSQTGKTAGASRVVVIPKEWKPPFALRFYCADDYFADPENHKPGQVGTDSFLDHRFKQVLIDETVVWERDVIDDNAFGSQTVFEVDITRFVASGKPFRLTLRVFDRTSTLERNDRDVWFIPGTWYAPGDSKTEEPPRFHTAIWFADPVVGEKAAVDLAPPGVRPHEADVAARYRERWPMAPPGDKMPLPATMKLVMPTAIPAPGFPITCGVPMPPGLLIDASAARLRDSGGREVRVQGRAIGWWPDGSIRWLLVNAIAPAGAKPGDRFRLGVEPGSRPAVTSGLKVRRKGEKVTIDTGAIRIELGGDPSMLVDSVHLTGEANPVLASLAPRMTVRGNGTPTAVVATRQRIDIVERGPVVARIDVSGSLDAARQHVGRFVFRLYAYAGLPTIEANFRIINDVKPEPYEGTLDDAALEVTDLALIGTIAGGISGAAVGIADGLPLISSTGDISLVQDASDHFAAIAAGQTTEGTHAQGWITVNGTGGQVQASMWRFWQQHPKSLKAAGGNLEIGLFTLTEAVPAHKPRFGEAKQHDIWLTFSHEPPGAEAQQALGLLADQPPRLFSGDWFCRSGGINVLDPKWFHNELNLARWVANAYGDISSARLTGQFGVRNFGDVPYGSQGQWCNGYWAMVQGALNWGLASGDQRWIERSFEIARHIADLDSVHLAAGHSDYDEWNGITCALGSDHSVHNGLAKWPAFQIGESLILHYWMTGDPDSLDAAVANADYVIRSKSGLGSVEARSQARPLLTLLRVWQATGKDKYRAAAERYLNLKYQTEHVIDWRRGAYIQPTYQNYRCISAGLDSMYAQNVYEYYRLTGDVDAAQLVVAIADSVYAESMLPQEEGLGSFIFYVRYSRGSWYYTQMAILFHMAYDLTGDVRFLRAGRAAFARYLLCADASGNPMYQPYNNFGWLDPEFGGWQKRFARVKTEPFDITTQTPEPDPARYEK